MPAVRMGGTSAAPARVVDGTAALIGASVGPHLLAFDLRSLRHIESDGQGRQMAALRPVGEAAAPAAEGLGSIDLRALLGVAAAGPGQTLLCARPGGMTRVVVDAGLRLLRVPIDRVHPIPPVLRPLEGLSSIGALVETEDGAIAWLVDPARLPREVGP